MENNYNVESLVISNTTQDIAGNISGLLGAIAVHYWWKNAEGIYLGCNDRVLNLLGLNSSSDIIGKSDFDLPWCESAKELRFHDKRVMQTKRIHTRKETVKKADGSMVTFLVTKAPYFDENKNVIGTIGTSIEITDTIQRQKELEEAIDKAELANQAKTEFLYNMRHDIRTPFSGILSLAQVLASNESDSEKKKYLLQIERSSEELLLYLNEILEFTQLESGSMPILSKPFDLRQLIESVIDTFKPSVSSSGIALDYEYIDLPDWIAGDRFRIQRILINLMSNAIKFTSKGHIKISVSLLREEKNALIINLSVEDTGTGIPLEKQDIIFEKFGKIGSSYDASNTGKGLGLRAVKTLVSELEGNIFLKSRVGFGSTFSCIIPFEKLLVSDIDLIKQLT